MNILVLGFSILAIFILLGCLLMLFLVKSGKED